MENVIVGVIIGVIVGYLCAKLVFKGEIIKARKQATKQARSVILGDVNEKMAPLFPDFPYDCKDLVFIGKGVDYLVFDGLARGDLRKIVLLEIKSGKSTLNRNEREIREKILRGDMCYEVMRL